MTAVISEPIAVPAGRVKHEAGVDQSATDGGGDDRLRTDGAHQFLGADMRGTLRPESEFD